MAENYRRHLCCRLSTEKVAQIVGTQNPLLQLSWLHGTRCLESLPATEYTLIPTGWLQNLHITPMTGELGNGCQEDGVNMAHLSGTLLDRVDWTISYATRFAFKIETILADVEYFFTLNTATVYDYCMHCAYLPEFNAAMRKLACWDQTLFQTKYLEKIKTQVKNLKDTIVQLERKKPNELYNWDDDHYIQKWAKIKKSLESIALFINSPLPTPLTEQQKDAVRNSYPTVLGSYTANPRPLTADTRNAEHVLLGAAILGKDIQVIFTTQENESRVKKFLKIHKLASKVQVATFDALIQAQELNKKVSPYLADLFSKKKLEQLVAGNSYTFI